MAKGGKTNIIQHFLTIGMGSILNMVIGLITTPILTRIVDPTELGQMSIVTTYSAIGSMVLCCGLDQALFRFFYEKDAIEYKRGLLRFCFSFSTVGALSSFIIVFVSMKLKVRFEFSAAIMFLLCVHITTTIWDRISSYVLRLDYKSRQYAMCNVMRRVVYLIFAIVPALILKSHYLLILIIASILSVFITFLYAVASSKELWRFGQSERIENKGEIVRFALPLIVSMSLGTLFQAIDRMSINAFCTYADVGIYSSAQTIISVFAIIQTTFNAVWVPIQVEHYTKHPEDTTLFQKGNQYMTVVMFALGIALIATKDIVVFLLGAKYRAAVTVVPFLAIEPIMLTISETTQAGIGYSKKSYLGIIITGASCLVNFLGNRLLIPMIGIRGAAISTGLSYIAFFALRTAFSNRYLYVDYKIKRMLPLLFATLMFSFIGTFYSSVAGSIAGFFVCSAVLIVLYRNVIRQMYIDLISQIKDMKLRRSES